MTEHGRPLTVPWRVGQVVLAVIVVTVLIRVVPLPDVDLPSLSLPELPAGDTVRTGLKMKNWVLLGIGAVVFALSVIDQVAKHRARSRLDSGDKAR